MRNMQVLGTNQRLAFHYLQKYGKWPALYQGWVINDFPTTRVTMESLVRRGLATKTSGGTFHLAQGKERMYVAKIRKVESPETACR